MLNYIQMLRYHERLLAFMSNFLGDNDCVIFKGSYLFPKEEIIDWEKFLNKIFMFSMFKARRFKLIEWSIRSLTLHLAT